MQSLGHICLLYTLIYFCVMTVWKQFYLVCTNFCDSSYMENVWDTLFRRKNSFWERRYSTCTPWERTSVKRRKVPPSEREMLDRAVTGAWEILCVDLPHQRKSMDTGLVRDAGMTGCETDCGPYVRPIHEPCLWGPYVRGLYSISLKVCSKTTADIKSCPWVFSKSLRKHILSKTWSLTDTAFIHIILSTMNE